MQQPPTTGRATQNSAAQGGSSNATEELSSDAKRVGEKAKDRIHSEVDNRKSAAVGQAQSVSSALEQTAGNLDDNTPDWLKSALQQGAQKIQQFADTIEQKDSRQMMREAQDFARNNPGTFLAACAAAGFAAARVFKAGGDQQSGQQFGSNSSDQDRSWGSGEQGSSDRGFGRSDQFGQQFDESSTGSSGGSQAFMARPETQSPTSSEFEQNRMEDDPLILNGDNRSSTREGGSR